MNLDLEYPEYSPRHIHEPKHDTYSTDTAAAIVGLTLEDSFYRFLCFDHWASSVLYLVELVKQFKG